MESYTFFSSCNSFSRHVILASAASWTFTAKRSSQPIAAAIGRPSVHRCTMQLSVKTAPGHQAFSRHPCTHTEVHRYRTVVPSNPTQTWLTPWDFLTAASFSLPIPCSPSFWLGDHQMFYHETNLPLKVEGKRDQRKRLTNTVSHREILTETSKQK